MTNAPQHAVRTDRDGPVLAMDNRTMKNWLTDNPELIVTARMREAGANAIEDGIGIMTREEMAEAAYIAMTLEKQRSVPDHQKEMEIARAIERHGLF
jgi:hypothetical protein